MDQAHRLEALVKQRSEHENVSRISVCTDLAEAAGVNVATVYRWRSGDIARLPSNKIPRIAGFFGVTEAELMGWANHNGSEGMKGNDGSEREGDSSGR